MVEFELNKRLFVFVFDDIRNPCRHVGQIQCRHKCRQISCRQQPYWSHIKVLILTDILIAMTQNADLRGWGWRSNSSRTFDDSKIIISDAFYD